MAQELTYALTQQHIGFDDPNITPGFLEGDPIQITDLREQVSSAVNEIVLRAGFPRAVGDAIAAGEGDHRHAGGSPARAWIVPAKHH